MTHFLFRPACILLSAFVGNCGEINQAFAKDALGLEHTKAVNYFEATYLGDCQPISETNPLFKEDGKEFPIRHELTFRNTFAQKDDPDEVAIIYEFFCTTGAYNQRYVYLRYENEYFEPLTFASPVVKVVNESDDIDAPLKSVTLNGFTAYGSLVNPEFDPAKLTLKSYGYWRGIGDAYNASTFVFEDGYFVLKHFEVDASYDGETKPQLSVDY